MSEIAPVTAPTKRLLVKDVLQKTTLFFREKGIESARLDAELLISSALGWPRMKIYLNYEYPMSEAELAKCRDYVRRRSAGEPVAYILGKRDFYNHSFKVSPAVLIPRPETEQIVEETSAWLKSQVAKAESPEDAAFAVVDFGTGSGCIGISIIHEVPGARLVAFDISPDAVAVAKLNAAEVGVGERAKFIPADVTELDATKAKAEIGGLADAVVANPPYISKDDPEIEANVKRFEPDAALFSGDGGLMHIRAWCVKAAELLRPDGWVMFEIGYLQGSAAREIFRASGHFRDINVVKDLSGRERFIRAFRVQA